MLRFCLAVAVVLAAGCGEDPTGAGGDVEWTSSLALAAAALGDTLLTEAISELEGPDARQQVETLTHEARTLADARDVRAAVQRVAAARAALILASDGDHGLFIVVLDLMLADAEERFQTALDASPVSSNPDGWS